MNAVPALVLGAVILLGAPTLALAAAPESAQALFDRGLEAFKAGRYDAACPALEQSYQLDPLPGALFTLAECEAKRGRFAAAASRYDEYLRVYAELPPDKKAKHAEREKIARTQRAAIALKVAELTLVLPSGAPAETRVTRDGTPLPAAALGVPAIVDPGEHVITVQVPGGPPSETRISLTPGEKKGIALDARSAETAGSVPAPVPVPAAGQQGGGVNRGVLIAGGVVAGGAAIWGVVFFGLSASAGSTARSDAAKVQQGMPAGCPPGGVGATGICGSVVSALDNKATAINAGVWSLVGAGVVGVGTLIYGVTGSSRAPQSGLVVAPVVTAQGGGIFARGSF
jgi:hypothetical protein